MFSRVQSTAVQAALAFIKAGYAIIPLAPKNKNPLNKGGANSPCCSADDFYSYVRRFPDLNYGILTGPKNQLVVLDIDRRAGWEALQKLQCEMESLPRTVTVLTGKGQHLYFSSKNAEILNKVGWRSNIDVRGRGGYVVGPGSVHESGIVYRYMNGASFRDVALAPMPNWLDVELAKPIPNDSPNSLVSVSLIVEGQRNVRLTRLAGKLQNLGLEKDAVLAALIEENRRLCSPPLDDEEVEKIATSLSRYPVHQNDADDAEMIAERVLAEHFENGSHLLFACDGNFWRFAKTHWQKLDKQVLRKITLETIQKAPSRPRLASARLLEQVDILLRARCAAEEDVLRFRSEPPLAINCQNCELWFDEGGNIERREHNHRSHFRYCLEANYNDDARCPTYDKAVQDIFSESGDPHKMTAFWDELMGYTMQPRRPRPLVVIGRGDGANGKTSLLQLFVKLMGSERVSLIPMHEIDNSRFTIGSLDGKLLLLDDDVKAGTRLPDGPLKRLSESKSITGEHKYGPQFSFTVRTLPMMLCNNMPSLADVSHGLRRRLMVVPFDHCFSDAEIDVRIFTKIASNEMSGVFNRFLAGLSRVIRADWYIDRPDPVKRATEEFVRGANPLALFVSEECENSGSILCRCLYRSYESWCQQSGIKFVLQRNKFTKDLRSLGYNITHSNKGDLVIGLSCTGLLGQQD